MKIAYDENGIVRMHGQNLPSEWNGMSLTLIDLDAEQYAEFLNTARLSAGVRIVNGAFESIPVPSPTPLQVIVQVEQSNPFTHRALREFFIGFGDINPAFKTTLLYQRAKAADDLIRAERAKL